MSNAVEFGWASCRAANPSSVGPLTNFMRSWLPLMGRLLQAMLYLMDELKDNNARDPYLSIAWSTDVVSFLRGPAADSESCIHDAANALRIALRVWLAGAASNS